jgi:serine/threonine-protein kinase
VTALLAMQVTRPAPPVASRRPGVPSRLAAAIDRCLAKHPDDRFPSAEALADALAEVDNPITTVPPQVRNFQRTAEQSTIMLSIVLVVTLASLGGAGQRWWAVLGGPVGAMLAVALDLGRRARQLLLDGFDAGDVIRAFLLERDVREEEVAIIYSGKRMARLSRLRRRALAVAGIAIPLSLGLMLGRKLFGWSKAMALGLGLPFYLVGVIAVVVGISSSAKAERRPAAAAARLWTSGFTMFFFRIAGLWLRRDDGDELDGPQPTRAQLPESVRRNLPELPRLLERYERTLVGLRQREEQVERALAEVGAARAETAPTESAWAGEPDDAAQAGGPTTRAVILHRRLALVNDLRAALDTVRARRTDVIAGHENVRIQLARVRAGIASTGDLQPDVATLKALLDAVAPADR